MPYLLLLPSLICVLALSIEDIRSRRIPRLWVFSGAMVQLIVFVCWSLINADGRSLALCLVLALISAAIQFLMAVIRPGMLGFGDVTCTAATGLAVGWLGLLPVLMWWCFMGILGLTAIGVAVLRMRHITPGTTRQMQIPFAPVIASAAVLSCVIDAMSLLAV
ncbi:MAG: prepilin peptidase [Bifidobacterium crudilactis]|jgi:leader peptidase (prepilin peptidase)/N-methyltransferase|uniref:prepilin peptidase n=1 Tax=Bifidobacterium crudilactis TaxID=327277 RepID=UPI0023520DEF|nr:prepilin peptidase [Bifidobacterium crudilactis]MCI1217750.1 prepilin peptidase [Bifidobacterium crudilactis]MCI1637806.1 prepilin peptidase [Bifidobacterium crudilactis]MCI1643594.1 prepilin peptidase [Bifidobacterium crudilactis]MCI1890070.1 prepilin peptidase [Bifidobacterium crudilactis]